MKTLLKYLVPFIVCIAASKFTRADIILAVSSDGLKQSFDVAVGDNFSIDLYVIESGTSDFTTFGLLGFGSRIIYDPAIIAATSGQVDSDFPFTGGGDNPDLSTAGQIDVFGGAAVPPKSSVIHLAILNFSALSTGSTTIRFGDLDSNFDDFSLNDDAVTSLDTTLFGNDFSRTFSFTVNITAVPEPSALCLLALGLPWLLRSRFRERSQSCSRLN